MSAHLVAATAASSGALAEARASETEASGASNVGESEASSEARSSEPQNPEERGAPERPVSPLREPEWCVHAGAPTTAAPRIDRQGHVYVATTDGYVHSFSREGSYRWSYTLQGAVAGPIALRPEDGTVWIGTTHRRVYALDTTGRLHWTFDTVAPVLTGLVRRSDGTLLFGASRTLYAVSGGGGARYSVPLGSFVSALPVPEGRDITWVAAGRELLRLEGAWRARRIPLPREARGGPMLLPEGVAVLAGEELLVFDRDGKPRWSRPGVAGIAGDGAGLALVDVAGDVRWLRSDGEVAVLLAGGAESPLSGSPEAFGAALYLPLGSGEVREVHRGGEPARRWRVGEGEGVDGITVDGPGRRFVATSSGGRICSVPLVE